MTAEQEAKRAARRAERSPVFRAVARAGYAANGLVHVLIGVITIGIARGDGGSADQSGALSEVAASPGGFVVLWAAAIGLLGLTVWGLVQVVAVVEEKTASRWWARAKEFGKAAAFAVLGLTALVFALGGRTDSSQTGEELSAAVLAAPGGVFLVAAVAAIVAIVGISFCWRGIRRNFREEIDVTDRPVERVVLPIGVVGFVAKGLSLAAVGVLIAVGAVRADPSQASGLDAGLTALAGLPFGVVLLHGIGVGLIAYGVYCGARARYAAF